jgi:3-oxoacyl-[acyl-carrier protein] reductase
MKLANKVAIVTGASKGIGAAIAKQLAAAGAAVVVNYDSSKEGADHVVAHIAGQGGKAIAVQGDMAKAADVKRLFAEAKRAFGALDILVNNAAVYLFEPLEAVTEDEFHREFNVNVLGPLLTIQEAVKYFGSAGGSIINLSSIVGANPIPNSVVYSATKGALDTLTRTLALELAPKKIRVNAIAPGPTATQGLTAMGGVGTDLEKFLVSGNPMGRLGQPDEIAKAALFLASEESGWITGERITVSGGQR